MNWIQITALLIGFCGFLGDAHAQDDLSAAAVAELPCNMETFEGYPSAVSILNTNIPWVSN